MIDIPTFLIANMGKAWEAGANGPDKFDCWGWSQALERECFGRVVEDILEPPTKTRDLIEFVKNHAARKHWAEVPTPIHGGLVELAHNNRPFHIGVFLDIDGGGISHAAPGVGVTFDTLLALKASGWRRFVFHDWIG